MNLNRYILSCFNKVIDCSVLANDSKNDLLFHNYYRLKRLNKGANTYNGEYNCGVTSFILGNMLNKYIPIKMYLYESGYGKYKEDHVFLKYNDIIIDTTYRQFLTDNRKEGFSDYNEYLYNELPPFFIGTNKQLEQLTLQLCNLNKKEFSQSIICNTVMNNWYENHDITEKLNNFDLIYNKTIVKKLISI
jgi:hypothetical protein